MPTAEQITSTLAQLSRDWWLLAIGWHVLLLTFMGAVAMGWRTSKRKAGLMLVAPLISVIAMAWLSANPFSTVLLGLVFIAAQIVVWHLPNATVSLAAAPWVTAGAALFVFGLVYPHFLDGTSLYTYLYAAPTGIVPCPTLSIIVGLSLIFGSLGSRSWSLVIGVPSLCYGIVGAVYLDVTIDWVLAAGAAVLIAGFSRRG